MTVGFDLAHITAALARYPLTADGLTAALDALGDSANRVADTLHRMGHRGNPGCDTSCPVANYLAEFWPRAMVSVIQDHGLGLVAEIWDGSADPVVSVPVPSPVADFIERFDKRTHYTDLAWHAEQTETTS